MASAAGWDRIRCVMPLQWMAANRKERFGCAGRRLRLCFLWHYSTTHIFRCRNGYGALTGREADSEDAQEPVHRDERKVDFPAAKVGQLRQCSL
jgi:hypothetical protein